MENEGHQIFPIGRPHDLILKNQKKNHRKGKDSLDLNKVSGYKINMKK